MNDLNSVILEGRLVKDPVSGSTTNGSPYCFATIASNRFYKKDDVWVESTLYYDVRTFGTLAENFKLAEKGRKVRVVGRLDQLRSENQHNNYITAEHIDLKPA